MWVADVTIKIGDDSTLTGANRAGFVLFAAFLLSFGFIRMSARLMRSPKVPWWPGSVTTGGGLHIHHLVFGIVLILAAGFVSIAFQPESPWLEVTAAVFGIGAGLTLDEFALWLHLEDVYWSEEGRRSVDAVLIAALLGGLVLTGAVPLGADEGGGVAGILSAGLLVVAVSIIALLKGKYVLGIAGLLVPVLSAVGAIRLAKPGTPWARWRYKEGSAKLVRADARYTRHAERYQRWQDRIGGAPDKPSPREQQS